MDVICDAREEAHLVHPDIGVDEFVRWCAPSQYGLKGFVSWNRVSDGLDNMAVQSLAVEVVFREQLEQDVEMS